MKILPLLDRYFLGALLGIVPLVANHQISRASIGLPGLAGFTLLGGGAAVAGYLLFARGRSSLAPIAPLLAAGFVALLLLLFLINIVALPNAKFLGPTSLFWDGVFGLLLMGPLFLTGLRRRLGSPKAETLGGAIGGALLMGAILAIAPCWPRDHGTASAGGTGPDLLVITVDAARRDHLGLYGYPLATSPSIDSLVPRARVYDAAYAASTWTRHAVPAILGVNQEGRYLRLADILSARGYRTASFSDNPLLEHDSQLTRGFHHVGTSVAKPLRFASRIFEGTFVGEYVLRWPFLARLWDDDRLVTEAIEWVDRSKDPWFLYVHLMDVHMPYKRPSIDGRPWRARRLMDPRPGAPYTKEEREDIVAHYDGGLRSADRAVGRLLTAVEKRGRPYVAVITADHGESLGEHGRWGHGRALDPEALRVPLLVVGEGAVPGRSADPVGHSAIGPTLLAAAGVPCHECGPGLRPSAGGGVVRGALPPHERYVIFAGHKLRVNKRLRQSRLYDLQKDPLETKDLAPEKPELAELLRRHLGNESPAAAPSAGDIERMRALGYLGSDAPVVLQRQ